MAACPACRAESPDDARFCPSCGSPLAPANAERRERRIVTSLFCDLVGFTSQSEAADPEDLDRMLEAYFALARGAIERHGGIVEKFIGDAVVGVFGVPVAHEDDPARAVRAGLEICAGASALTSASGDPLRLRVGINTGETFAHLDVRPDSGEHILVGDAVNTAARIQSAAPELGVAVGARTWEATRLLFEYEELPAASLKGKAGPVRLFHARSERRARGTDASRTHAGPYVGRKRELARLRDAYAEVDATGTPTLAIVAGEPGIGKSRILAELAGVIAGIDPAARWLQGRCLPYGDGTGFWALGEIVKTHAGIREDDDGPAALAKLEASLARLPERAWLQERLLPLLGLAGGPATREELFAAWGRYLSSMAQPGPAVIAFEDVHWADPALLAFVDELAATAEAPLLIVVTARPTMYEAVPEFAAGLRGVVQVDLEPLGDGETVALVDGLLGSITPDELREPILRRSEGNPLFAEELVRLLLDRDLLVQEQGGYALRAGAEIPMPESIHALLASRLDALSDEERTLLAAAAIVGSLFWDNAAAHVAGMDTARAVPVLAVLEERELVRHLPASSMAGEAEYAFWHALARDVAYGSQPRGSRLDGHLAVAAWIQEREGRREDTAGVVAHHLSTALELAIATGDARADAIKPRARASLADAASNALGLDPAAAAALYAKATELAAPGTAEHADLLVAFGTAASRAAQHRPALDAFDEALAFDRDAGDVERVVRTMLAMRPALISLQDQRWVTDPDDALRLIERRGPSPLLVEVLVSRAHAALWDWSWDDARSYAQRALDMAAALGLPVPPRALNLRGRARLAASDLGGFQDCEAAIEAAGSAGDWDQAGWFMTNYAADAGIYLGLAASLEVVTRGIELCEAHGLRSTALLLQSILAGILVDVGRFDEAVELIDGVVDDVEASGDVVSAAYLLGLRSQVALARGDVETAAGLLPRMVSIADTHREQDDLHPVRVQAAAVFRAVGNEGEGLRLLRSVIEDPDQGPSLELCLAAATRLAIALGDLELADTAVAGRVDYNRVFAVNLRTARAAIAEARGDVDGAGADYLTAVEEWLSVDTPFEAALASLGAARCLAATGDLEGAMPALAAARTTFEALGAQPALGEVVALEATLAGGSLAR